MINTRNYLLPHLLVKEYFKNGPISLHKACKIIIIIMIKYQDPHYNEQDSIRSIYNLSPPPFNSRHSFHWTSHFNALDYSQFLKYYFSISRMLHITISQEFSHAVSNSVFRNQHKYLGLLYYSSLKFIITSNGFVCFLFRTFIFLLRSLPSDTRSN